MSVVFILKKLNKSKNDKKELMNIINFYDFIIPDKIIGSTASQIYKYVYKLLKTPYIYGSTGIQGKRPYMEDMFSILKTDFQIISCMFDGHGGVSCSKFFNENYINAFLKKMSSTDNVKKNMTKTLQELNDVFLFNKNVNAGSTANIFYIDYLNKDIYNLNLGDSRSIIGYSSGVKQISTDHSPDLKKEARYIRAHGGSVVGGRINGVLAVSRALGDRDLNKYINTNPDIFRLPLTQNVKFILHASDGLFDVLTNEDIYNYVMKNIKKNVSIITNGLVKMAYDHESTDNISASLIIF